MRKVLIGVALLILGVVAYGFTLPRGWRVDRSITIQAAPERVYPWLEGLQKWPEWAMPEALDLQPTFEGNDGAVGSTMRWAGGGTITVTRITPGETIEYELRYSEQQSQPAKGTVAVTGANGQTTVVWTDEGDMGSNPLARFFISRVERDVGNDMEQGLARLKRKVEAPAP